MGRMLSGWLLALGWVVAAAAGEAPGIKDDFSGGGWKVSPSTPGELVIGAGKLVLTDPPGKPDWFTVSKKFDVDLDAAPFLYLKIARSTGGGEVKVTRNKDKHSVLKYRQPGVYSVDLREKTGWKGKGGIEVALYVSSVGKSVELEYVGFAAAAPAEAEAPAAKPPPMPIPGEPAAELEFRPLFASCGYYWRTPAKDKVEIFFRPADAPWTKAFAPVRAEEAGLYRGSLVNLAEDTAYAFKATDGAGATLAAGTFTTWSGTVPVAKTVVLSADTFKGRLKITERGKADGWIKYVAAPGFVLANDGEGPLLEVEGAAYILLEGLTLRGGSSSAMTIRDSHFVRVVNCDLSGWGLVGQQRFDKDGKFYLEGNDRAINYNGGIFLTRGYGTVIERCYFHDPRNHANSWRYSHPAGPQALMIDKPRSTVLRYNDLLGGDRRRWNDAVEGTGNFHADGGFNRDADIYGNWMVGANDDALELDGGQQNVRCFRNKFESFYCGVSVQGCMTGPSFVFDNLFTNAGDEFGSTGQLIKTSSNRSGPSAASYIFNNTFYGRGSGIAMRDHLRIVAMNNLFAGGNASVTGRAISPKSESDHNLLPEGAAEKDANGVSGDAAFTGADQGVFTLADGSAALGRGAAIDNFAPPGPDGKVDIGAFQRAAPRTLPYRPIPVETDLSELFFKPGDFTAGGAALTRTVTATVGGDGFAQPYTVRQNEEFDWLEVSPAQGVFKSGDTVRFTVRLKPERMTDRFGFRGGFLLRLDDGFSRPVSVHANREDLVLPPRPTVRDGAFALFIDAKRPTNQQDYPVVDDPAADGGKAIHFQGAAKQNPLEYAFDVPRDGSYFLFVRLRADAPRWGYGWLYNAVNDDELLEPRLKVEKHWSWQLLARGKATFGKLFRYELKQGKNTLRIAPRDALYFDLLAVTDDPGAFEAH